MTTAQEVRNKIKEFKPTSVVINLWHYNLSDKSERLYKFRDNGGTKFKIYIFTNRVMIETPLETSLLFSINLPDKVCLADKVLDEISGIGKIFTDKSNDDVIRSCVNLLTDDLKSLKFESGEGLSVYGNALVLTLRQERPMLPEIEACKNIKAIIELNFPDKVYDVDYSDLPDDLRRILEKFESLAISDDLERDETIQKLTKTQRSNLIEAVEPRLDEINSFLNTFHDNPFSEGAIKLQCLAELVLELTIDQKKKNR